MYKRQVLPFGVVLQKDFLVLYAGEYTVKQIMEAMLVPSGNDAAYVLSLIHI